MTPALLAAAAAPAVLLLPWSEDAVYPVAATPGRVTDIALEPGEQLAGAGPVAAGDTARWIIGTSESGAGAARRVHVLVKPVESGLATNLVVTTDRRTYHLELRATGPAYAASVSWRYPAGELVAVRGRDAAPAVPPAPPAPDLDLARLNFGWRIEGRAPWRPIRVFDDGRRVVLDFPGETTPPLFERGADGALAPLDYRASGRRVVVDRLFGSGELRLGTGRRVAVVRLTRVGP
jgi:type IV secretion system protein VirB9